MRRRPAFARALLLLLALVPVVWGTCPRWLAGLPCAPTPSEVSCPCCVTTGDAGAPSQPDPYAPDSCPVLALRHTIAPAPPPCEMPAADGVGLDVAWAALPRHAVEATPPPPRLGTPTAPDRVRGGAPPPRAGTVVLLI